MGSLRRRLNALEKKSISPLEHSDWSLEDQLENVLHTLDWFRQYHADGRVLYPATDRELAVLAIAHALEELEGEGELTLPASGTTIHLRDDDGESVRVEVDGARAVVVEDLPPDVQQFIERMEPKKQEARDDWLYKDRHRAALDRERIRFHREHGYDVPTPEHLRWWEGRGEGSS